MARIVVLEKKRCWVVGVEKIEGFYDGKRKRRLRCFLVGGRGEDFGIFLEQFGELGSFEFRVVAEQVPGFPDV
jgi:hypothetical protein